MKLVNAVHGRLEKLVTDNGDHILNKSQCNILFSHIH